MKKIRNTRTKGKKEGIVYILTNSAMPGLIKIGKTGPTDKELDRRINQLDNTNVPAPFECFYAAKVKDHGYVEKKMHLAFAKFRERSRREFFRMDEIQAKAALEIARGTDMTPRHDIVIDKEAQEALDKSRRGHFKFSMVKLRIGTKLQYTMDTDITCTITSNDAVIFKGKKTSLSQAAKILQKERGYKSQTIAGPNYWQYKGETLKARRLRLAGLSKEIDT